MGSTGAGRISDSENEQETKNGAAQFSGVLTSLGYLACLHHSGNLGGRGSPKGQEAWYLIMNYDEGWDPDRSS